MKRNSPGFKRYRSQKLNRDILNLTSKDLILDNDDVGGSLLDESIDHVPGFSPREHVSSIRSNRGCQLTQNQIIFLKNSLKDYPDLIKEIGI